MSRTRVGYRKTAEKGVWWSRCEKVPQQGQLPREKEDTPDRYPLAGGPEESHRKDKSKERRRTLLTDILWFLLTVFLALQLCGVGAVPVGGEKGGNITLKCGLKTGVNLSVRLTHGPIIAYGYQQDNQYKGRVHESDLCDLILEDLKTTDAGMYKMGIYGNGDPVFLSYEVLVSDTLTAQKGEELVFGDLPRDAESVRHQTDTGWTEVWKRGQGVLSDRLTDNDGHLVIRDFGSSDAGEYRVLNKTGGILITLTVKESGTESKGNLNSTTDHTHVDTEHQSVWVWIVAPVVSVASVALVVIMVAVFRKLKSDPMTPTSDQEMRFLPGGPSAISCSGVQIT